MDPSTPAFGFIGLGVMGVPMVERLLDLGHRVAVWNRTPSRCAAAVARGARLVASLAEMARHCDLVGLCLSDGAAVEAVTLGEHGLLAGAGAARRVTHLLDFSTGDPAVAVRLAHRAGAETVEWIDCPVSGGPPAAAAGTLIGFAGASEERLQAVRPLTDALFARVTAMGGPGSGQLAKLCNQMIVASNLLVIAEALAAARTLGIDAARLPRALAGGFADSAPLQLFGPRMATGTYEPRLGSIRLMRKDVHLAAAAAGTTGLALPMLAQTVALYDRVERAPHMSLDDDISSIIRLFESASTDEARPAT